MSSQMCELSSQDISATEKCCNPKKVLLRYLGLVLMCLIGFGSYFCYDNPSALRDKFEIDLNMRASNFILLYSVYSWPNVILCFIGGFLLDKVFGIRWGTIIYATVTLCGHLLFAVGAYENIFWLMFLGRFIFGIGAESLIIAQSSYAVLWFKGKALNTLFGLQLSFSKLGSTANSLSLETIYRAISENAKYSGPQRIGIVLFISATVCFASLIFALLLGYMDKHAKKILNRYKVVKTESIKVADIKDFGMKFWLTVLICAAYYVAILPFISLGKVYLMTKYELEPDQANTTLSLVYIISAVFSPLFGILIDKIERNILWVLISIIGSLCSHGILAFTYMNPYISMIILGISYSMLASSLWPMIALIIPEHQLGTAYGITQSLQNLNLAVMNIICGIIVDNYGYFILELFFIVWLLISLVPAILIYVSKTKTVCNR